MYKGLLDREPLRAADGVQYFRDTLRLHFIKGAQSVFLWRFYQFNQARSGNIEMVKWIGKFSLLLKRVAVVHHERRVKTKPVSCRRDSGGMLKGQTRSETALDQNAPAT